MTVHEWQNKFRALAREMEADLGMTLDHVTVRLVSHYNMSVMSTAPYTTESTYTVEISSID